MAGDANEWRPYVRPVRANLRADLDTEFGFHLDMLVQELVAAGMTPAAARMEAERRFGARAQVRDLCLDIDQRRLRRAAWRDFMRVLWQDIRYALRSMRKNPGFSFVVCLTLALGIGATTAMFSVVNGVLLRKLPYPAPDRMVILFKSGGHSGEDIPLSWPDYTDWKRRGGALFSDVVGWIGTGEQIVADGQPELLLGNRVSANTAAFLGITPLIGRGFRPEEELVSGERVVMISERFWRRRYNGDPSVLGRTITMSGEPYTIIGVLPSSAAARLPSNLASEQPSDFWLPLRFTLAEEPRDLNFMYVAARLAPGISRQSLRSGIDVVAAALKKDGIDESGMHAKPLTDFVVGSAGRRLAILLGAVTMLLLIGCVNVANLLLARASVRSRELGVRVAMGAGQGRIVAQLLAESVVQALVAGVAGVAIAVALVWAARNWLSVNLPRFDTVNLDGRALAFAAAVSILSGVAFGVAPALRAARSNLAGALREGRGLFGGVSRDRLRRALVVTEVALSFVLLVGAGLLVRTLHELLSVRSGVDPDHVLTAQVGLPTSRYADSTAMRAFYARLVGDVRAIPGVQSVALVSDLPGIGGTNGSVSVEGLPFTMQDHPNAEKRIVSTDYFQTMKAKLVAGRFFRSGDDARAPVVLIVNRTFVDRYLHGRNPIGARVGYHWGILGEQTVAGVIDDIREGPPDGPPLPAVYISAEQRPNAWMFLVVRSALDQASLVRAIRGKLRVIDPELPLSSIASLSDHLSSSVTSRRAAAVILGAFAALALVLAAVGLYGVMSYSVTQRMQELGIRAALGADRGAQLGLVLRQGGAYVLAGLAVGVVLALGATRLLASQLFGVRPTDAATFGVVALLLASVSVLALLMPAARATRADPMQALRAE